MKYELIDDGKIVRLRIEDIIDILTLYMLLVKFDINILVHLSWQYKSYEKAGKSKKRIHFNALLEPIRVNLSGDLNSLRVTGKILDADVKEGVIGRKAGVDIKVGDEIIIFNCKGECLKIVRKLKPVNYEKFIVISFDDYKGAIVFVNTQVLELVNKVFSGGKLYNEAATKFDEIGNFITLGLDIAYEKKVKCIISYPRVLESIVKEVLKTYPKKVDVLKIYCDVGGYEGIIKVLKSKELLKLIGYNRVLAEYSLYSDVIKSVANDRIIYGPQNINNYLLTKRINFLFTTMKYVVNNIDDVLHYLEICIKLNINLDILRDRSPLGSLVNKFGGIIGIM